MTRLRLAALLLAAFASLTAAAQTTFDFYSSLDLDQFETDIRVRASAPVKALTHVHWTYSFPTVGISESGTLVFEPGDQFRAFDVQYPNDAYRPLLIGTATISYGEVTKSSPISVFYWEPYLIVDEARVVESSDEQAVTFRLSRPSTVPITLNVFTVDGSANDGSDFTLIDHTVTFPARITEQLVRFSAPADGAAEGEETFEIAGQSASFLEEPYLSRHGAMIVISDAEIGSTLDPATADVFGGDTIDLGLTLTRPLHPTKAVTISIGSSNPEVARPRFEAMDVPGGMTSFTIPVTTDLSGDATITVTFPDETA
ncbi:MAG TPA: Calx-beta domain-containing protein, partial [Thermoanaerobaculia bacterium]|nr:Calx-beta domain-containing protein [Thermoanaerobaculia bacterium]